MDRELQPAETLYDAEDGLLGGAPPDAPRDGEALPNDAATLPQPPEPGGALPDLTETSTPPAETGTTARCIPGQRAVNYTITHPNQTRFECPVCKLTYTSHHSLVRHVGVSHSCLVLTISYKCALCDYAHPSLRSTSSHYRLSHGAAVPPVAVEGSNEKACPFCPRKFPSTRSCSTHIREKHMEQASAPRAREAADKEAQRGTTTTGTKWGEGEIGRFKEALARLGPSDNAKLAEAVGTRDKTQVSAFKCRFLKKYPTWLKDHRPPGQQAALNLNDPPTPSPTSPQAMADHHPPSTRSESRKETAGTPPSTPGQLCNQEEAAEQSPHTQTLSDTDTQEEKTPSPQPASISAEATLKLQHLDRVLGLLRNNQVERWEPEPMDYSPRTQDLTTQVDTPLIPTVTQGEGVPRAQLAEEAMAILTMDNIQPWDPEEEMLSPSFLAGIATPPSTSSPLTLRTPPQSPPPDTISERQRCSREVDSQSQPHTTLVLSGPVAGRQLGNFEWVAFEEVLNRWTAAIKELVTAPRHRPPNRTSQWARRRSRREQGAEQEQELGRPNNRASGYARRAARGKVLQKLYQANPGACMRRLLDNTPPVYCNIGEQELVAHYAAALAEPPPLGPPPTWLFPNRHPEDSGETAVTDKGDVLQPPVTPDEVVCQLRRAKRTAPGADGITYAGWKWIDPQGLILATIYNTCRTNARIPREWKHSTVTLIHKGGDVTSIRNWRPICLQLTLYKLYSAIIARRIASWAMEANAFSPAQKGFLAYDGCAEHNFLLRSVMVEARRNKRNLLLAWLDLKDAFGSVPHDLILLLMKRLGLSGSAIDIIKDIYSQSTIAIRTGRDTYTAAIKQNRGVKQGCPLSPILFNIALEGLLKLLATNTAGFPVAGYTINSLAYADDVCMIATSKSELQGLLDQCHAFTTWAGLVFKAKKCGSLCMTNEAPRLYVNHLYSPHLGAEAIPALTWDERYKYLGCPAGATRTPVDTLQDLRDNLLHDTGIVFASELAEWQKLDAFRRRFLFPRVTFALKVVFPGTKWSQKLDTALRTTIKRGLRLPSSLH